MKPAYPKRFIVLLSLILWTLSPIRAGTNLVYNGSFELIGSGWLLGEGLGVNWGPGAADGEFSVSIRKYLAQDLQVVPGRLYMVSFSVTGNHPTVKWDGVVLNPFTNYASAGILWKYGYVYVRTATNVARLSFEGIGTIDDVEVLWVEEPPEIITQPEDRAVYEGHTVSFAVRAESVPPFSYQWRFNGDPIPGATNKSLTIGPVRRQHGGTYSVVVSNPWNSVTSREANLHVSTPPGEPLIISQPVGDRCPIGYRSSLAVIAVGEAPLSYQWNHQSVPLPGETNSILVFPAVDVTNAGSYTVLVGNHRGTVLSLPALVTVVTNPSGGGILAFDSFTNNAAVFDVDGSTRVTSPTFVAQVYASASPDILRPVGPVATFGSGFSAGYLGPFVRTVPDVAEGQFAYVQVRAWESAFGPTYEAARAHGGKYGRSQVLVVMPGRYGALAPMESFALRAGEPLFVTGKLSPSEHLPDSTVQFMLTGETGARYLIESRQLPNHWMPLLILTNTAGTCVFSDPNQSSNSTQFYRARILD